MQMTNFLMKYTKLEREYGTTLFKISDYTELNLKKILQIPESTASEYLDIYSLMDDETIENISYKLYGDEKYWDLLLLLNEKDPLFDMCYSITTLQEESFKRVKAYEMNIFRGTLPPERFLALQEEIFIELYTKNEYNRKLRVIKPSRLSDYIRILRINGFAL